MQNEPNQKVRSFFFLFFAERARRSIHDGFEKQAYRGDSSGIAWLSLFSG
jgi:hypothetical protein